MENHYNLIETAKLTGMKVRTVREWIRNGKLKATKINGGRLWVVSESEIRRVMGEDNETIAERR